MKRISMVIPFIAALGLGAVSHGASATAVAKKKILVVDSYHREYMWSQETHVGFCSAMLKFEYFDNEDQIVEFTEKDQVETSKAVFKKTWMDSKRLNSPAEQERESLRIYEAARKFEPNIMFLGDDNAAKYIGAKFLDTKIPIVFWGLNSTPVKYGLLESAQKPGHNVTGVYQTGYHAESLQLLKALVPKAQTFAILSDQTTSGRTHYKAIEFLARQGLLPMKLMETAATNSYEDWQEKALELQEKVDVFFVPQYSGLSDKYGKPIPESEVTAWYFNHIKIPEASLGTKVRQGMLCAALDAGYSQGFEAAAMGRDILENGRDPATYPALTPKRGPLMVNKERAEMLGITLSKDMGIEEYVEKALALENKKP